MRLLFLTPSVRLLGARQSLLALVTRLPSGYEPLVVCPGTGGLAEELQRSSIPTVHIPHGAWRKLGGRLTALVRQLPALRKVVRGFSPNLIHCNEFHSTPAGVRAALASEIGGKLGVTSHVRLGITPRQIRTYDLAGCRRIVAVSRACRDLFAGSGLEDRVRVVYNGVDVSGVSSQSRDPRLRAEFGWGDDVLVLGLLGLVSPRKNQMIAAEAVAIANAAGIPARLLLAGDPFKSTMEYGEELRRRIERDDLRGKVRWLPFQRDVLPLYGAMDANLLISGEEGFGRTIIESAALGVPSIGARIGGIPELILERETGWLVDEGDAEALARVIADLWRDRAGLAESGERARIHATRHFTIGAHVEGMLRVWDEALET